MAQMDVAHWACDSCDAKMDVDVNTDMPKYQLESPAVKHCPMCGDELRPA